MINRTAFVQVACTKCGRLENLTPDHIARMKAAGIPYSCKTGIGCSLIRNPKNQTLTNKENNKL
ncbi:MAG: hypothetical protein PCFJNLEI_03559 [Verrucomicrobiae bacterium]|nr:hypothetical protein [Verrucomicrobiae bacterium]